MNTNNHSGKVVIVTVVAVGVALCAVLLLLVVVHRNQPQQSHEDVVDNHRAKAMLRMVINQTAAADDGVTDVTVPLQKAIDSTPPGDTLILPPPKVAYKISAPLTISQPITIVGRNSLIIQSSKGQMGFNIASSNVCLQGINIRGQQFSARTANENGINIVGASAQATLTNVVLLQCNVSSFGLYGVYMQYVNGFTIRECQINNINHAGIECLSVLNGAIKGCTVNNIVDTPNAYGIAISRNSAAANELVSDPLSANVLVDGNTVTNVTHWEGLDTHAGQQIIFRNNFVYGCNRGIMVGPCPNKAGVDTYAPKNCIIEGNVFDSQNNDGATPIYGITLSGAAPPGSTGNSPDLATGCVISNNVVKWYGQSAVSASGAYYITATKGLSISGGTIIEPGRQGIFMNTNNYGFTITGVTVIDAWSNNQGTNGIGLYFDYNQGAISGCSVIKGTKVATNINTNAVLINNFPNIYCIKGPVYSPNTVQGAIPAQCTTTWNDPGSHGH